MSIATVSIKRPIFTTCLMVLILAAGLVCFKGLSIDLFPQIDVPVVSVMIVYPGAGPSEIETLVTKPLEEDISSISGLKRLTSKSLEGVSQVVAEFVDGTDGKYAEQQVRDKVSIAKTRLPKDAKEPLIRKMDPSDQPILTLSVSARLTDGQLYDLANDVIKPRLEQVNQVGAIEILGGRKREIHVQLDRDKLKSREISVMQVAGQLGSSGENIPSGKVNVGDKEKILRSLGEFRSVQEVSQTLVNLYGNEVPTRVSDIGSVTDTLEDEKRRVFVNGEKSLFIDVYRQSSSNTVAVADGIKKQLKRIQPEIQGFPGNPEVKVLRDSSVFIRDNVNDVYETIVIGIILTIITVFFFLGSGRSTLITGMSIPICLVGAFILMFIAGFSINVISLMALSLAVGLLIDDAIVVIENIYRRMEGGEAAAHAAEHGTGEIQLAVMAITMVVISVFVPVAFMGSVVGQFLKQFGLTVAFAMAISLFVALTLIPMLTAYFAHDSHGQAAGEAPRGLWAATIGRLLMRFDRFQTWMEMRYERILRVSLRRPVWVLVAGFLVFIGSLSTMLLVPGDFIPEMDKGEITVTLDLPPGINLDGMQKVAFEADRIIRANPEVVLTTVSVGGKNGEANQAELYVKLKGGKERRQTTSAWKETFRQQLTPLASANPIVKDFDMSGGMGTQPFTVNLISADAQQLDAFGAKLVAKLRADPRFKDVDTNLRPGKPEFQVRLKPDAARLYGINSRTMGEELRAQVEGFTPAKYRESGREYDVRVRLLPEQRNLEENFSRVYVPNINRRLVKLSDIAGGIESRGASAIDRQNRGRYIQVTASVARGYGLSEVMGSTSKWLQAEMPAGMRYMYVGTSENFEDMIGTMITALAFGILLIYLILSSLYESFVTPFTILLALPLALCGAFLGLFLAGKSLNLLAILGVFMLLGVSGKNSILLVDFARQRMGDGLSRVEALIAAGRARLRPILMTSFALIAGTLPVALGMSEISKMRSSMGIAIVGGMISSTLLTLIVVPAAFVYIDLFREWSARRLSAILGKRKSKTAPVASAESQPLADEGIGLTCEGASSLEDAGAV